MGGFGKGVQADLKRGKEIHPANIHIESTDSRGEKRSDIQKNPFKSSLDVLFLDSLTDAP